MNPNEPIFTALLGASFSILIIVSTNLDKFSRMVKLSTYWTVVKENEMLTYRMNDTNIPGMNLLSSIKNGSFKKDLLRNPSPKEYNYKQAFYAEFHRGWKISNNNQGTLIVPAVLATSQKQK